MLLNTRGHPYKLFKPQCTINARSSFFTHHHHQSELVGDVAVPVSARQAVLF